MAEAAVIPALIGGAGQIGGAVAGGKGAERASRVQLQGTQEALAFQRQQAAREEAAYREQYDQWIANRNMLLQRYGIDIAPPVPPRNFGPPQGRVPATGRVPGQPAAGPGSPIGPQTIGPRRGPRGQGLTLGEMAMRPGLDQRFGLGGR